MFKGSIWYVVLMVTALDALFSFCSAQSLTIEVGSIWKYSASAIFFDENSSAEIVLEITADTIVDSQRAMILSQYAVFEGDTTMSPDQTQFIIYQEGMRIYHYVDNGFKLLYDFSSQVGDTISVDVSGLYGRGEGDLLLRVDSTRVDELQGIEVPSYYTSLIDGKFQLCGWNIFPIGNILYFPVYDDLSCDYWFCPRELICAVIKTTTGESINFGSSMECLVTASYDMISIPRTYIYPNPVHDFLTVRAVPPGADLTVRLISPQGQVVKSHRGEQMSISGIPGGIYYVLIDEGSERMVVQKIVVID